MLNIAIISSSVRIGRKSHRVALYLHNYITEHQLGKSEILDLKAYNFPLMEERLQYLPESTTDENTFAAKIKNADAVIVVTPEYNSGYPASLKNVIDLLTKEWYHKPIGLATASGGSFGGVNAMALLQNIFLKIKAVPIPAVFPVPMVQNAFDEEGIPTDKETTDKRASAFMGELIWFATAFSKMNT